MKKILLPFLGFFLLASFSLAEGAAGPTLFGHEFAPEGDKTELAEQLKKDAEFVREADNFGHDRAVSTLRKISETKTIHPDTRHEAMRHLLLRFERASGKRAKKMEGFLAQKLRSRQDSLEMKKQVYDSLAGEHTRALPFLVSVAADKAVPPYIRFQACRDLENEKRKLKPGQRQIVRTALGQVLKSKEIKENEYSDLAASDVQDLLKQF